MLNNQRVTFINMKNFPLLDENGKEWWISRSIAVTGCVFTFLNGKWCVLANCRIKVPYCNFRCLAQHVDRG